MLVSRALTALPVSLTTRAVYIVDAFFLHRDGWKMERHLAEEL